MNGHEIDFSAMAVLIGGFIKSIGEAAIERGEPTVPSHFLVDIGNDSNRIEDMLRAAVPFPATTVSSSSVTALADHLEAAGFSTVTPDMLRCLARMLAKKPVDGAVAYVGAKDVVMMKGSLTKDK